jgi:hypothetical protein
MNKKNKLNTIFTIFIAIVLALGCSGDQQAEANKIVAEANKKIEEARSLMDKTESRNKELFNAEIQTLLQLKYYKMKMESEAKSIVQDYEKVSEMLRAAAKQFDDISRMDVTEKYKEYAKIKSDEFAKRSEAVGVRKGNAQAFLEVDDPKVMTQKFDENNTKAEKIMKEAEELGEKAKKIETENKDLFKDAT